MICILSSVECVSKIFHLCALIAFLIMESKKTGKDASSLRKKLFDEYAVRISNSGRKIVTPKHVLSTSDEEYAEKKAKNPSNVKEKIQELKEIVARLQKNKVQPNSKRLSHTKSCNSEQTFDFVHLEKLGTEETSTASTHYIIKEIEKKYRKARSDVEVLSSQDPLHP